MIGSKHILLRSPYLPNANIIILKLISYICLDINVGIDRDI